MLGRAIAFAAEKHQLQVYGTDPYILHPLRVLEKARVAGKPAAVQLAAVLHDVVEDTGATLDEIRETFGTEVSYLVGRLTRAAGETYFEFIERAAGDIDTNRIKRFDIEDHLSHNPKDSLRKRYEKALYLLVVAEKDL